MASVTAPVHKPSARVAVAVETVSSQSGQTVMLTSTAPGSYQVDAALVGESPRRSRLGREAGIAGPCSPRFEARPALEAVEKTERSNLDISRDGGARMMRGPVMASPIMASPIMASP